MLESRQARRRRARCSGPSQTVLSPDRANLLIGRELAARRLSERLVERGRFLGRERNERLIVLARELQYEARDLVLHLGRKISSRLDGAFEQFGHGRGILRSRQKRRRLPRRPAI